MRKVHRSKIDSWLLALLTALIAVVCVSLVTAIYAGGKPVMLIALLLAVVGIGLPLWVLLTTRYTLDREVLLVRSDPFRWKVPVAEISGIMPTRNPLSSPALSLDRLRIVYGSGKSLMISSEDKERFIADLEALRAGARAV